MAIAIATSSGCFFSKPYRNAECKKRAKDFTERVDRLKAAAEDQLRIGASRSAVTRFFHQNRIPLTFTGDVATGTIKTQGCSPAGCGSDDAIIALE
jgi:hypothetical protein